MNITLVVFLCMFYALPISLGILLIHRVLIIYLRRRIVNTVTSILFSLLLIFVFIVPVLDLYSNRHRASIQTCNGYTIDLTAYIPDSFLDWQANFVIRIEDPNGELLYILNPVCSDSLNMTFKVTENSLLHLSGSFHEKLTIPLRPNSARCNETFTLTRDYKLERSN